MKPIQKATLFMAGVAVILATSASNVLCDIAWVEGYDRGLEEAESRGKPAMMDFTASWCGWCVKLDKDTFTDPTVQELARSFVCVKVNMDKEKANAKKWSIRGIPHILFLAPDGSLITRISGYKGPSDFAKAMRTALKKYTPAPPAKKPKKVSKPLSVRPPQSPADVSEPLFVECTKCKNIFNATSAKGTCPRCGTPYELK